MDNNSHLIRRLTQVESFMAHSPYSTVSLLIRIKGPVDEGMLRTSVTKAQQRHAVLRTRMVQHEGDLWLTTEDVGEIPIDIFPWMNEETWINAVQEDCTRPYAFDRQPAIRFLLLQSKEVCDLVIQCHHSICDGLSLAYLGRDLLVYLGVPDQPVEVLPDPVPIGPENFPRGVKLPGVARFIINRMNKKWLADRPDFDQQDYLALNEAYWQKFTHRMLPIELSKLQTEELVARCREEGVTVNTALVAAFIGAQTLVLGDGPMTGKIGLAADLRHRMDPPAGEEVGYFAGGIDPELAYDLSKPFWENARQIHKKLTPEYTDKKLFAESVTWSALEPSMLQAINYKRLGGFVAPEHGSFGKLSGFSQRNDVVTSMLERNRMTSLDELIIGSAVTNLTRLDFPTKYGPLELERMILKPGGAFPLATVNLVVGAVTVNGQLSLLIEYAEERLDARTAGIIKNQAITHLLSE